MHEYLERASLETSLNDRLNRFMKLYGDHDLFVQGFDECIGKVEDFPNAKDVAQVRHGRWNSDETCSCCGKKSTEGLDAEKWNYWFPDFCPHCGAIMNV